MKITLEISPEEIIAVLKHMDEKHEHEIPPFPPEIKKVALKYTGSDPEMDKAKVYFTTEFEWKKLNFITIDGIGKMPKMDFELGEGLAA